MSLAIFICKIFFIKTPIPGENWHFRDEIKDPFPPKNDGITILDLKDGWVRYSMGKIYNDERMKLREFLLIYGFRKGQT